jgi:hypothetical protein
MDVKSTANLLKDLSHDDLIFAYTGSVSDSITHKIIELTQYNIDSAGNFVKLKNKISFLMAECYQNVARHGKYTQEEDNLYEHYGAFYVRSVGEVFNIASANTINRSSIASIKEKLDKVNSLSSDELRLLQKEVLAKGKLSERGGAGLGIIEMARRTGQKISYDFEPLSDNISLFFIQLTIQSSADKKPADEKSSSLEHMKSLYTKMRAENLIILHKGDFSENSVLPIIHMIEKNILRLSETKMGKQKLYNVSVELLQNISMHAYKGIKINEALFALEQNDNHFNIGASNYIENDKIKVLTDHLDYLQGLSKNELNELYREKLRLLIDEDSSGIGIGLIYIFRKCNKFNYSITSLDDHSLLTIVVEI